MNSDGYLVQIPSDVWLLETGPDQIFWISDRDQGVLTAPGVGTLAAALRSGPVVDGHGEALDLLLSKGLAITDLQRPGLSHRCGELGIGPRSLERNRWQEGASVIAGDSDLAEALGSAAKDLGLPVRPDGAFAIVAIADYLDSRLQGLQDEFRAKGRPWMLAKLAGTEVWIGPIFQIESRSCWRCLTSRLLEHRWLTAQLPQVFGGRTPAPYADTGRLRVAGRMVAEEAARWLLEASGALEDGLWTFSWQTMEARRHALPRHPQCPKCGIRGGGWTMPALGGARCDARLRSQSPAQTAELLDPISSPITGIIRGCEESAPHLCGGYFIYSAAVCPPLPPPDRRPAGSFTPPVVCAGVGASRAEAKAVCLAEAVERYSIQFHGDEPCIRGAYASLAAEAIAPNEVLLFSAAQLGADGAPEAFDETEEIEWLRGWSLSRQMPRLLPMALGVLNYRAPGKRWIGSADSSGCAAGTTLEEAALHGMLELIERDALSIWWYNRIERPDLGAEAAEACGGAEYYQRLRLDGWSVRLHDITTDLPVPAAVAIAHNPSGEWIIGSAAHIQGAQALCGALREAAQLSRGRLRQAPLPELKSGAGEMHAGMKGDSFELTKLVTTLCEELEGRGLETSVFDCTRPDVEFPVVRVVIPGLRHKARRLAPGRLYDVPVRLGWLGEPAREEELAAAL